MGTAATKYASIALSMVLAAAAVHAEETFTATLLPVDGTGTGGSGSATLVLSGDLTEVTYEVFYFGLSSPEVAAHIHRPLGGVAVGLVAGNPKNGIWQFPPPADIQRLRDGELYILIHSENFPMGELRGDIRPLQVPVEHSTWGRIKGLYGVNR